VLVNVQPAVVSCFTKIKPESPLAVLVIEKEETSSFKDNDPLYPLETSKVREPAVEESVWGAVFSKIESLASASVALLFHTCLAFRWVSDPAGVKVFCAIFYIFSLNF
jgi:hypothetical protein